MIRRILTKSDKKCLYKFIYNMGWKGFFSFNRYQKRLKKNEFFPAFHFISVTDDCNLNCQGCWVTGKKNNSSMSPEHLHQIISETKSRGSYFFGILGGEPLMYKPLFDVLKKHHDCYFQLFTNGTMLTPEVAEELRRISNITPLISFEGDENTVDIRRGGKDIYQRTINAIENSTNAGLITGVAISVCKSNLNFALSSEFILSMIEKGVIYLWYYIYRPVGNNSSPELALNEEEIQHLREFMVDARLKFNIALIDTYWDHNGTGLCPAAAGLSHHINASGFIEPCPVIQFATDRITDKPLTEIYRESEFLSDFRQEVSKKTNGCILMEEPEWLADFVEEHKAFDTSGRGNEGDRLKSMSSFPSHGSGKPLPEKSWIYKFAKKRAFFGLGAYG